MPPAGPDDRAISVHLDKLLADRGMTLTELSDRVGVSVVNLSILKNGRARAIRFSTLTRLCEVLGCQPAAVLVRPDRAGTGESLPPAQAAAAELFTAISAIRRTARRAARQAWARQPLPPAQSELLRLAAAPRPSCCRALRGERLKGAVRPRPATRGWPR